MVVMLAVTSVFQPTMSGLDATWSALAVLWALVFVGAYGRSGGKARDWP